MKKTMLGASRTCQPKTGSQQDDLLTQEELAARLKVGLRTLVRLQHEGVVPCIVLGKTVRFYWPAVVSYLNANSTVCVPVAAPRASGPSPQTPRLK
jgi:excisionase family DNA binding protein